MGLTKEYLRFVPGAMFGVIGNSSGNVLFFKPDAQESDFIAVGACENVVVWNCRKAQKEFELRGDKSAVTTIKLDGKMKNLAAGYADGIIRIFHLPTRECLVEFSGHRTTVSCLAFDADGFRLVSGGMDTEIVVWDVLDQTGLCRLKGHNNAVTQCHFLKQKNVLVSCSRDGLIKFWNLDLKLCFRTVMGDNNAFLDLLVVRDSRMLAATAGGGSSTIFVYDLSSSNNDSEAVSALKMLKISQEDGASVGDDDGLENHVTCDELQQIPLESRGSETRIAFAIDRNERIFGYHTFRKTLNLFKVLNSDEIKKRIHRAKKKLKKQQEVEESEISMTFSVDYEIDALKPLTFPCSIVSFASQMERGDVGKMCVLFRNNSISLYQLTIDDKNAEVVLLTSLLHSGHRTNVQTLAFGSSSFNLLSASKECVKIWNMDSKNCICTLPCEPASCSVLVPGNDYCLVGTRSGKIQIFDITSAALLENVEAHGQVECMCLTPDQRGLVTGGHDKGVNIWDLELVKDEKYSSTKRRLTLVLQRTIKMPEVVLCVKCSPNNKLLAVSLLDSTVKVLFADTLKSAFLLHSHTLPVRCIDISDDSKLIVTGSDDRKVKIWSLDFGNCNKSISAHEGSVTCIQFLPNTHLFFTASEDKKIKQWDADNFQKVITLEGHQHEIKAMAISPGGGTVVSASYDKSLRVWEKTDELLILSEEQEMEREALMDKAIAEEEDPAIPGDFDKEASLPGKKTVEVTKGVDRLIEAIDVYQEETSKLAQHMNECEAAKKDLPPIPPHPLFIAFSAKNPIHYMQIMLRQIRNSDLQETLLLLPFSYAIKFIEILVDVAPRLPFDIERVSRCVIFLQKIHNAQLTSSQTYAPLLNRSKSALDKMISEEVDRRGFVLAGLRQLQRMYAEEETPAFRDVTKRKVKKKKKCLPILKSV